ncbi:ribosomal protein S11 (chloroplast) [Nannochloropsis oceanica]|uniref:Small ribosomal subunit protein uS11c n=1 Tax=Nannochloropsis oceanica TaxID=145522 RepID=T1RIY1_9STRA|nr:ribosomal protein S11 [Nannochloropsis oceanica]AGI98874.1 ribosomal protein S11 [Nannochloropsis oceanica]AGI99373.1 ribosomal protein S11 [Nannochloropsis oceanica]AHX25284.1 30S ribosomal protein S11 [Nannochloropsis oceanica]
MNQKLNKGKRKINLSLGFACIHSTFNNTIISITDPKGNVVTWASAGSSGFKGSRKKTQYAAQMAAKNASAKALKLGIKKVGVILNGPGNGREIAIKGIHATGLEIISIEDKTGVPHNGCRAPKRRRV